jgi:hypothetical protein
LLPGWIDAFLRHSLIPKQRWLCCFAYIEEQLIGVLPVITTPHPFLGASWVTMSTPFDGNTPSGDVLLVPHYASVAVNALLAEVCHQVPHHLSLDLKAVRQNSPVWAALQNSPQGYTIRLGRRWLYSRLDVSGDFSSYWSTLGKMRRNLRYSRNKLENLGQDISIEIGEPASPETFWRKYLALDASGWKGRNGTAISDNPSALAFYTTLISNLAAQGRWEWQIIRAGERVIAAGMGVRCGSSLILPKYAFDEDCAFCSPGNLLTEEVFKDAFSRVEIDEINHMSLSDSDRFWRMSQDEYVDVHLVSRSVIPMLLLIPRIAVQSLYRDHVRSNIPEIVKGTYRKFKRWRSHKSHQVRKSRFVADSRSVP